MRDRTEEFEEMHSRQNAHSQESPEEFVQRRIRYHAFLFPGDSDGRSVVAPILRTQPVEWGATLEEACPSIPELLTVASRMGKTLESQYLLNESLLHPSALNKSSAPASNNYGRYRKRNANAGPVLPRSSKFLRGRQSTVMRSREMIRWSVIACPMGLVSSALALSISSVTAHTMAVFKRYGRPM